MSDNQNTDLIAAARSFIEPYAQVSEEFLREIADDLKDRTVVHIRCGPLTSHIAQAILDMRAGVASENKKDALIVELVRALNDTERWLSAQVVGGNISRHGPEADACRNARAVMALTKSPEAKNPLTAG